MRGGALSGRPILSLAWTRCCAARDISMAFVACPDDDPTEVLGSMDHPAVVLVDLDTASQPWIDVLVGNRSLHSVVVSPPVPSTNLRRLLAGGCRSLLTPRDEFTTMSDAMDALLRDEPFTSSSGLRLLFEACGSQVNGSARWPSPSLTSREREVLRAMVDGSTIKATARALGVAAKTIEGHRKSIFTKLGVTTQTEAIMRAMGDPGFLVEARPTSSGPGLVSSPTTILAADLRNAGLADDDRRAMPEAGTAR